MTRSATQSLQRVSLRPMSRGGLMAPFEVGYLTVIELAEALRVSPGTVYYWASRNEIPFHRFGKHLRFRLEEVERHFQRRGPGASHCCTPGEVLKPLTVRRSLKTRVGESTGLDERG